MINGDYKSYNPRGFRLYQDELVNIEVVGSAASPSPTHFSHSPPSPTVILNLMGNTTWIQEVSMHIDPSADASDIICLLGEALIIRALT